MSILIPSKNIYSIQNPKIINNMIDRVEVNTTISSPDNQYNVTVYNTDDGYINIEGSEWSGDFKLKSVYVGAIGNAYQEAIAYTNVIATFKTIPIQFPAFTNTSEISKVFYGQDKYANGTYQNRIKSTIKYKKYTATQRIDFTYPSTSKNSYTQDDLIIERNEPTYIYVGTYDTDMFSELDEEGNVKPFFKEVAAGKEDNGNYVYSKTSIEDITDINKVEILSNGSSYQAGMHILCGKEYYTASKLNSLGSLAGRSSYIFAEGEKYEPISVEITVYGNTIGINFEDSIVYINGKKGKKVFSVDKNELIQEGNYYQEKNSNSGQELIPKIFGKVQSVYANGKETATLRCDIGEYYNYESYTKNENGTITVTKGDLAISTKKQSIGNMFFKIGDEVIPMVRTGDGTDKFMSVKKDGSPKVFTVIGTKIYFDGAIYQELTLQEKTA